jgi:hypothetical protein
MSFRNWVASKLKESEERDTIENVSPLGESSLEITSKKGKTIVVGVLELENISDIDIKLFCDKEPKKPQMLIAKSSAVWQGNAIDYARKQNMGWGGMGLITNAFDTETYSNIQRREFDFVEKGLVRHTRVVRVERLFDRVFRIHRSSNLPPFTIALVDSYEMTGEAVQNAFDKYGKFDGLLNTNPNGNPTGRAYSAAGNLSAEIFVWRTLLGRLNKK